MDSGHGWVAIVWTTSSRFVSMTETWSSNVSVTKSTPRAACIAVGCRPTSMDVTGAAVSATLITLTVPVVVAPVTGSAGTWVP